MPGLNDLVPISSITPFNVGLSSARADTMVAALGRPASGIDAQHCWNNKASDLVNKLETTLTIEKVHCTGIKPAIQSLDAVLQAAFAAHPELKPLLVSAGMLCVRLRRPTSHIPSTLPSNHSWGTAVDLALDGHPAPGATGDQVPYFIALLIPFFNEAGWYSGVGFTAHDDMHFEVADETIRQWAAEGAFRVPSPPATDPVATAVSAVSDVSSIGLDCPIDCTRHAAAIAAANVGTVVRYYRWPSSKWQPLTHGEAVALSTAGLRLATIWEADSTVIGNFSFTDGFDQASSAFTQARKAHQPPPSPIYFAVDFDCDAAQIAGPIADYFRGVAHAFQTLSAGQQTFSVGIYGSGRCCGWLKSQGLATHTWLADASRWGGSDAYADWDMKQGHDDLEIAGLHAGGHGDYDSDVVRPSAGTFLILS